MNKVRNEHQQILESLLQILKRKNKKFLIVTRRNVKILDTQLEKR